MSFFTREIAIWPRAYSESYSTNVLLITTQDLRNMREFSSTRIAQTARALTNAVLTPLTRSMENTGFINKIRTTNSTRSYLEQSLAVRDK